MCMKNIEFHVNYLILDEFLIFLRGNKFCFWSSKCINDNSISETTKKIIYFVLSFTFEEPMSSFIQKEKKNNKKLYLKYDPCDIFHHFV